MTIGLALGYLLAFLYISTQRLTTPFELEWMEGGMLAHALRLKEGLAIYAPPSLDFVPFFYTPGYPSLLYWLDALGLDLSFTLARSVSLLSTLGTMGLIYWVIQKETQNKNSQNLNNKSSKNLALLGVGLYAALFRTSGAFYDLARPDALMLFLLCTTIISVYYAKGLRLLIVAAILMTLAFFTKQTAAVFFPVLAFYSVLKHKWRGLSFGLFTLMLCSVLSLILNEQTAGSFWAYIFEGHQGHVFYWKNIGLKYWRDLIFLAPITLLLPLLWFSRYTPFKSLAWLLVIHWLVAFIQRASTLDYRPHMYYRELFYEEPRWLILIVPITLSLLLIKTKQWGQKFDHKQARLNAFWLWIYIAGAGASALNHSTQWAYSNCFMLLGLAFSLSAPLMLNDLIKHSSSLSSNKDSLPKTIPSKTSFYLWAMLIVQLMAWLYSPRAQLPQENDHRAWEELKTRLDQYSAPLFFPAHPSYNAFEKGLTGVSAVHTHQMGIRDVAYRGGVSDIRKRLNPRNQNYFWSAVITHEQTHIPYLERGYYEANRWIYLSRNSLRAKTGFLTRPQSLWLPKGPSEPRLIQFNEQAINLNFEHESSKSVSQITIPVWSEYRWKTNGQAFGNHPYCQQSWPAEGRCGASSGVSSGTSHDQTSKFKASGMLYTELGIKSSEHLSLLAKVVPKNPTQKRRRSLNKIELRLTNKHGHILARNKVRPDAKWHRIILVPQLRFSDPSEPQTVILQVIDQDPLAYIMIDDVRVDQALDW